MTATGINSPATTGRGWTIALWTAQIALAIFFGMTGYFKGFTSPGALEQMGIAWAAEAPIGLLRFIGVSELAGAVGVILPALLRIEPELTPLAALGFVIIQALAIPFHIIRGESGVTPLNLALLLLALFVVWGRSFKSPIAPRS
jgi:hypothetical protein